MDFAVTVELFSQIFNIISSQNLPVVVRWEKPEWTISSRETIPLNIGCGSVNE
jgi:hypothetical protein